MGTKSVYIQKPEDGETSLQARVSENSSSTALVYSYIGGQWISDNTYAPIPGTGGGVGVAFVSQSVYSEAYDPTYSVSGIGDFINDIVIDVTAKANEIQNAFLDYMGFDPDIMTQNDWEMVTLGISAGIVETTFPERSIWNPVTVLFNKDNVKSLLLIAAGLEGLAVDSYYYLIKAKTYTEYAIMIAATIGSIASYDAAIACLKNAGISFSGGLAIFGGTGGTGLPISLVLEVESAKALAKSGICTIAGVAIGKVAINAKEAFNNDVPKLAIAEYINKIEKGLRDINYTNKIEKTAEELNTFWKSKGYENPPYKADVPAYQIELTEETNFVKVYDGVNSNEYGQFVMKLEDITNADGSFLTAQQIKDKYALEFFPKYVADAKIPAGTTMNCGIAGPIEGWGSGGGLQFDLNWQKVGNFTYRATLGN